MVHRAPSSAAATREAVSNHVGSVSRRLAAERFGEKAEEWLEMKDSWVEGTREYVREHPVAALGIAVAAGYVLSMLMRSRG